MACGDVRDETQMDVDDEDIAPSWRPRGYACILVNIEGVGTSGECVFKKREGALEDYMYLRRTFCDRGGIELKQLNTRSHWYKNITLEKWDRRKTSDSTNKSLHKSDPAECCLQCLIKSTDFTGSEAFVFAISSHGEEVGNQPSIILSDGNKIYLSEIIDTLSDKNCPTLRNIPRILILQACRTNSKAEEHTRDDRGVTTFVAVPHHGEEHAGMLREEISDGHNQRQAERDFVREVEEFGFQCIYDFVPRDFLVLFPAVAGKRSKRNTEEGSWMLADLSTTVTDMISKGIEMDFLDAATRVAQLVGDRATVAYMKNETGEYLLDALGNKIVNEEESGLKTAVCLVHRLRKPLVFRQVVTPEVIETDTNDVDFKPGKKKQKKKR
ncbi:CASP2-like protein, partial [Mya arenaria]